jgi:ACS family D-galactonate transporter-like MFS transporter
MSTRAATSRTSQTSRTSHGTTTGQGSGTPRGRLRWAVVGMCFLGVAINYLDRANLSIAMPEIVKDFGISHTLEG